MSELFNIRRFACIVPLIAAIGCHGLLEVSDPTLIQDGDIANAGGANARRLDASNYFVGNIGTIVQEVAYITDEWTVDFPASSDQSANRSYLLDNRQGIKLSQMPRDPHLGPLTQAFWETSIAIPAVRAYTPDSLRGDFLAQLYAIRGYVVLQMAEDLCPGFPITDVVDNRTVYGGPVTTDSAMAFASMQLDSALKYARDSSRFVTLARVTKGRALLDQGEYSDAAAMVANVPTTSVYATEQSRRVFMRTSYCNGCYNVALGEHEGGNGLPFVSAHDPRIPLQRLGPRNTNPDDTLYVTTKGSAASDVIILSSGIEARLIQAEAAIHGNDDSWKPILDSLRATVGLAPLVDPGTPDGRINILYSERAFWLFMTGRRLGDLRRLVRNYGRNPEDVFPSGTYLGGNGSQYGSATSIPFGVVDQESANPHITSGCTSL